MLVENENIILDDEIVFLSNIAHINIYGLDS